MQTLGIHDGSRLGPYRLSRLLGRGATSAVYEAADPAGRRAALKVFHVPLAFDARHAARFLREARVAKEVRHPNIVETVDCGEADGQTFLAMELMGGDTLASLLRRCGRLPLERALGLLLPIGSAVQALHGAGIVHRDIEPSNILLTGATPERAKLSDFGISTLRGDPTLTRTGDALGTPAYMAPELIVLGATAASDRSDQYSLAATFYECVTGQRPFGRSSTYETMRSAIAGDVAPPSSIDASLPAALDDVLRRAIRPSPDERFESVSEFTAALRGLTEEARRERRLASILPARDTSSTRPSRAPSGIRPRDVSVSRTHRATAPRLAATTEDMAIDADETWEGLLERIEWVPADATVRGMFLGQVHRLLPQTDTPKRRYIPFTMYPVREYMRLLLRAARARCPNRSAASALVELGFGVYDLFSSSIAGSVILAAANSNFASVCRAGPKAYDVTLSPGEVRLGAISANEATIHLRKVWVFPDIFHAGIWLGAMRSCDLRGRIEVTRHSPCDVDYHMTWSNR